MTSLSIFDFDGTLFRSPAPPSWWSKSKNWWSSQDSLGRPCVPDRPDGSWWVGSTVTAAKQAISDPDTLTVLCTGREDRSFARWRIPELLQQKGLHFDQVILNPGAEKLSTFKQGVLLRLLHQYPEIEMVHVWEDRADVAVLIKRAAVQTGRPCTIHFVREPDKEPLCTEEGATYETDPGMRGRIVARWIG